MTNVVAQLVKCPMDEFVFVTTLGLFLLYVGVTNIRDEQVLFQKQAISNEKWLRT